MLATRDDGSTIPVAFNDLGLVDGNYVSTLYFEREDGMICDLRIEVDSAIIERHGMPHRLYEESLALSRAGIVKLEPME